MAHADKCFVLNAKTGERVVTRTGEHWLVLDLNNVPRRIVEAWFRRGFYFAPAIGHIRTPKNS